MSAEGSIAAQRAKANILGGRINARLAYEASLQDPRRVSHIEATRSRI